MSSSGRLRRFVTVLVGVRLFGENGVEPGFQSGDGRLEI